MKTNTIKTILTLTCIIIGLFIYKKTTEPARQTKDTIIIGMMSGWAPYMSINNAGEFEGFDVDVAEELGKKLNKNVEIKDMGGLASLLIALNQGKIDMAFSGLDITKKRQNAYNMVQYSGEGITTFNLLFWDSIPKDVETIFDLKNLANTTLCYEPGSPSEAFLNQEQFDFIDKKPVNSVPEMIMELKYRKSLCALYEPLIVEGLQKKNPQLKYIKVAIPEDFQIMGIGVALNKTRKKLTEQVTKAIKELRDTGTIQKLEQRWNIPGVQS